MKITAVISEYNPFHFGHKYQLEEIKKNSDAVIVIMSGPFVQRGEAAITDKWTRAKAALLNGADLVFELPVIYALNSAKEFAFGAVRLLDGTGVVDELCFGSECGDINKLLSAARALENEPKTVSDKIQQLISSGLSYPAAREIAFEEIIPQGVLSEPNNILAVEYIRALLSLNSSIAPATIKRCGSGYHDIDVNRFASATGIRDKIFTGKEFSDLLPCPDFDVYCTSNLDTAMTAKLRMVSAEYLSTINGVSEGLENRIKRAALIYSSIDDIASEIKTKRYTMTRIKRILISALLDITSELASSNATYLRVLGMNNIGTEILRQIKNNSDLDIITKTADYKKVNPVFDLDIRAQNIFALCGGNKKGNADLTTSPIVLK